MALQIFPDILNRLLQASPNIEELHLKNIDMYSPRNRMQTIEFYSYIRFNHLIVLDIFEINLFDGSYLPMVFNYYLIINLFQ